MKHTAKMKNPATGEVREVEATPEVLTPLMVAGWVQVSDDTAVTPEKKEKR